MKLFNWLFKKEKGSNNVNLVNLQDFIKMPSSSFYNEHTKEYQKYYKEYTKVLKEKQSLTSVDITINEDINLHINNITRSILELDNILDPVNNNAKKNNIDLKIIISKLKYYMIELNDYKDKLFIKWKVLKDINKKIFLSNNKRCAINERINSIINELVIVNSNMNAISLEISTYLNLIDASNIKIIDNTIEFLTKRYNTLKEYLHTLKIKNKNEDITIENIVYMEILLEKYIAKKDIIKYIKDNVGKNHDYDRLITMCVIVKDFSNKEVDDLLEEIIKQKVKLYKENCKREGTLKEPLLNNKISIYEANVLEKIIFNEINTALENTKNKEKRECLRNILMDETGYNIKNILKDTKKLSVLFNINYNLYDFFSKTNIKNNLNLNCYTWSTDEISLLEYFRIIEHIENVGKKDIQIIKRVYDYNNEWNIRNLNILNILKEYYPYYELYKTLKFNKKEICFRVKRICFDFKNITDEYIPKTNIESEIEKIMFLKDVFNYRKQNGNSVIYANAKLESFHFCGSLLENILSNYNNLMKCSSLEFNLNNNKLKDVLINYANTPYEVKLGPNVESCILRGNVKFVTFENFQNSKVLSDAESIRKLLGIIYGYYYTIRSDFDVTFIFSGRYSYQVNLGKIVKNFGKNKSYNEVLDILPKKIMRYINEFKILETKKDANLRRTRP